MAEQTISVFNVNKLVKTRALRKFSNSVASQRPLNVLDENCRVTSIGGLAVRRIRWFTCIFKVEKLPKIQFRRAPGQRQTCRSISRLSRPLTFNDRGQEGHRKALWELILRYDRISGTV